MADGVDASLALACMEEVVDKTRGWGGLGGAAQNFKILAELVYSL